MDHARRSGDDDNGPTSQFRGLTDPAGGSECYRPEEIQGGVDVGRVSHSYILHRASNTTTVKKVCVPGRGLGGLMAKYEQHVRAASVLGRLPWPVMRAAIWDIVGSVKGEIDRVEVALFKLSEASSEVSRCQDVAPSPASGNELLPVETSGRLSPVSGPLGELSARLELITPSLNREMDLLVGRRTRGERGVVVSIARFGASNVDRTEMSGVNFEGLVHLSPWVEPFTKILPQVTVIARAGVNRYLLLLAGLGGGRRRTIEERRDSARGVPQWGKCHGADQGGVVDALEAILPRGLVVTFEVFQPFRGAVLGGI